MIKDNQISKAAEIAGVHHAARGNGFDCRTFLSADKESLPLADAIPVLAIAAFNCAGLLYPFPCKFIWETRKDSRRQFVP